MARNDGVQYEALLHEIFTVLAADDQFTRVERNVQLPGHAGPRQIDVLITSQVVGMPLKTIVECRDHNRILDVTAIDAFQSKLVDVGASKGVLVSRKGFSGTATKKAKRVGITLCTASNAAEILLSLGQQIPIVVTEIAVLFSNLRGRLALQAATTFDRSAIFTVNDKWIPDVFREEVLLGIFKCPLQGSTISWSPQSIPAPHFIRDASRGMHTIEGLEFSVTVNASHFFGHINDLPEVVALHNQAEGSTHVILKSEDIPNFKQRLVQYSDLSQIPRVNPVSLVSVMIPTVAPSSTFSAKNVATGERLTITSDGAFKSDA